MRNVTTSLYLLMGLRARIEIRNFDYKQNKSFLYNFRLFVFFFSEAYTHYFNLASTMRTYIIRNNKYLARILVDLYTRGHARVS